MSNQKSVIRIAGLLNGAMRAFVCAWVIFGLLAAFAFRQTAVLAQTSENEPVASPESSTQNFTNAASITINDNASASLYPSNIAVSGVNPALVTRVEVRLNGFTHTFPDDVDVILVGPGGQRAVLMSDAGGSDDVSNINLTFSLTAATLLPETSPPALTTGTYRPANYETAADTFPAPGPGALNFAPADLSVFNATNPNGTWSLYVVDDAGDGRGQYFGRLDFDADRAAGFHRHENRRHE